MNKNYTLLGFAFVLWTACKTPFVVVNTIPEQGVASPNTARNPQSSTPTVNFKEDPALITEKFNNGRMEMQAVLEKKLGAIKETDSANICYKDQYASPEVTDYNSYLVKYDENFPMRLGYGIDPKNLQVAYMTPLNYQLDTVEGDGSVQTKFEAKLLNNYSDLKTFLEIDYKAKVSAFGYGGGSISANFNRDFHFTENTLYFVVKASTVYGRIGLKNITLKDEAINLYKTDPNSFINKYGYAFPIIENHGSKIYLIFKLHTSEESLKESLSTTVSGNIDLGVISGSSDLSIKATLDKLLGNRQYELSVFSEGSQSFSGLDAMLKTFGSKGITIDSVVNSTARYLNSFTFRTAAPISYDLLYYRQLGLDSLPTEDDYFPRFNFLEKIIDTYNQNNVELKKFDLLEQDTSLLNAYFGNDYENDATYNALKKDKDILLTLQQYLYASFDTYKSKEKIPDNACVEIPSEYNPYRFPSNNFFAFDFSNLNSCIVTGKYLEEVSVKFRFFIPGTGDIEQKEIFNTSFFPENELYNSIRSSTSSSHENTITFDAQYLIKTYYTNKIKKVIASPTRPSSGIDLLIYDYLHTSQNHDLKAFVYINVNNIIGIDADKVIAKVLFDKNDIEINPF